MRRTCHATCTLCGVFEHKRHAPPLSRTLPPSHALPPAPRTCVVQILLLLHGKQQAALLRCLPRVRAMKGSAVRIRPYPSNQDPEPITPARPLVGAITKGTVSTRTRREESGGPEDPKGTEMARTRYLLGLRKVRNKERAKALVTHVTRACAWQAPTERTTHTWCTP